jgi:hypothetical protein
MFGNGFFLGLDADMKKHFFAAILVALMLVGVSSISGNAVPLPPYGPAIHSGPVQAESVAVRHRGTTVARGPRGGMVAHHHRTVARLGARPVHPIARPGVRPGVRPVQPIARPGIRPGVRPVHPIVRPGRPWVRPPSYYWRPGGAIVAGAAIGFVAATSVGAHAGAAPGPGYCWYYTDLSMTKGFWDVCP